MSLKFNQESQKQKLKSHQSLVSVVVPCYNHQKYVQECVKSIIAQDYKNIELIVIDDGSTDQSSNKIEELIEECEQRFIRFEFRKRPNKGLCETLNEALQWCEGEFLTIVASDDVMKSHKLSAQVNMFELSEPDIATIFSGYDVVDENRKILKKVEYDHDRTVSFAQYYGRSWLCASSAMFKRSVLAKVGGYDASLPFEDLDMWLRLLRDGFRFYILRNSLLDLRKHGENMSNDSWAMFLGEQKVYWKHRNTILYPLSFFASLKRLLAGVLIRGKWQLK